MDICIIHGSPRKGNTYRATSIFMREMEKHGNVKFTEFFLPKSMPHFCNGCANCFEKGEEKCPHVQYVGPIVKAIIESDGLIFTSPVYVMGESGGMKALLDHLAYIYIPHRPRKKMFSKVAIVISTAAGGGTSYAIKNIARNLRFWGVPKVYKSGFAIFAENWDAMKEKKKLKFENTLSKKAKIFYKTVESRQRLRTPISTRIVFTIIKKIISTYADDNADKIYWEENDWLSGKDRPF